MAHEENYKAEVEAEPTKYSSGANLKSEINADDLNCMYYLLIHMIAQIRAFTLRQQLRLRATDLLYLLFLFWHWRLASIRRDDLV